MAESGYPDNYRFPVLTVLLVLGSLLSFLLPAANSYLLYDRNLVLSGQVWRLVTGVMVHFSWSHLVYNTLIMMLAGWMVEQNSRFIFIWLVLLTAILSSLYFLMFMPGMKQFGGLSGIASATVGYLCMANIRARSRGRWLWVIILVLLVAKVTFEIYSQQPVFATYTSDDIRVVPETHIIGLLVAMVLVIIPFKITRKDKGLRS